MSSSHLRPDTHTHARPDTLIELHFLLPEAFPGRITSLAPPQERGEDSIGDGIKAEERGESKKTVFILSRVLEHQSLSEQDRQPPRALKIEPLHRFRQGTEPGPKPTFLILSNGCPQRPRRLLSPSEETGRLGGRGATVGLWGPGCVLA